MTTEPSLPEPVERALENHDAFAVAETDAIDEEEGGDETETEHENGAEHDRTDHPTYELTTTVFEAAVTATPADDPRDGRFHVTVTVPTLDAAVANESVADVVEDGWFETFERRLADTFSVASTETHEPPTIERDGREVRVRLEYVAWDATTGVDDAKTLIEYVEGTYAQGIIPGYEYRGPARELLENAQSRGQQAANGTEQGTSL